MPQICENITLYDELNLFLVSNRIKPLTTICLVPFKYNLEGYSIDPESDFLGLDDNEILKFKKILSDLDLSFFTGPKRTFVEPKSNRSLLKYECVWFDIAKDYLSLKRLLEARTERELGLAFGFPEDAVNSYRQVIDGELREEGYLSVCLAKCKKAGLEIPTWLAYLTDHIPRDIDLAAGKVSESSRELGMKYQEFTRKHNPQLAERVENIFLRKPLPVEWELMPDGHYQVYW